MEVDGRQIYRVCDPDEWDIKLMYMVSWITFVYGFFLHKEGFL
jgi:hypothetical protein